MKQSSKKTVTIGICTYNEQKNIGKLLETLCRQEQVNFTLKSINIEDDASSDKTKEVIKRVSDSFPNIKINLFSSRKRLGKVARLNSIYKKAKTEIIITLDGDVSIKNNRAIGEVVSQFSSAEKVLVFANVTPLPAKSFFGKIVVAYESFWKRTKKQIDAGLNIHNATGCLTAMTDKFYSNLQIPPQIIAEDHFLYLLALKLNYQTGYAEKATVYYKSPQNLRDYLSQFSRYHSSREALIKYFGNSVLRYYDIPRIVKINAYRQSFLKNPVYIVLAIILQIVQRIDARKRPKGSAAAWLVARSSK